MKVKSRIRIVLLTLVLVLLLSLATFIPALAQDYSWWDNPDPPNLIVIVSGFPFFGGQAVSGQGWDEGDSIDLYINEEYVGNAIATPNAEGNASPIFDVSGWGVIEPGDEVKVVRPSDGLTKEHIVTSFTTFVNAGDDKVYGTAARFANMFAMAPIGGEPQYVQFDTTNAGGYWSVDFSSTFDITYDTYISAGQYDEKHDITAVFLLPTENSKLAPVSVLVNTYGGLANAAIAMQFDSVKEMQEAIRTYYSSE